MKDIPIEYKTYRFVDGKVRHVIVDENGKIVNRRPSKEELRKLEEESYKYENIKYTDKELLDYPRQFYEKYRRAPTGVDFDNSFVYPNRKTYDRRFGSFQKALKLVELDFESMVKKGILDNNHQKGRFGEIIIRDHFEKHPIDLAGENCKSPCDGICPNGKVYDVKSSKLYADGCYKFGTKNKYKKEIELYYFLAFNKDWTKLDYGWRIPGEIAETDYFQVGPSPKSRFDIEDMEEYNITDKLREILLWYRLFRYRL